MAKHTAPPRRRHSAQKHTSHKGVTLYTLGVLLVAVSVLLSLRFWPRRIVDAVPPAAEVESPAVSEELAVPEPQPVVTTLRFSATGDNLIHEPIYSQAARRAAESKGFCSISMHSRTSTGSIRKRSAAKSLRPLPIPASRPPASAPKRFTGQASGCSASRTITPTIRELRALPPPSDSGRRCLRM